MVARARARSGTQREGTTVVGGIGRGPPRRSRHAAAAATSAFHADRVGRPEIKIIFYDTHTCRLLLYCNGNNITRTERRREVEKSAGPGSSPVFSVTGHRVRSRVERRRDGAERGRADVLRRFSVGARRVRRPHPTMKHVRANKSTCSGTYSAGRRRRRSRTPEFGTDVETTADFGQKTASARYKIKRNIGGRFTYSKWLCYAFREHSK